MTLVEVVVASVVFSMVMLATVTAMRTFGNSHATISRTIDATDRMREVHYFVRDSLRNAVNESGRFFGDADQITWLAPLDRVGAAGGLQYLRLYKSGERLMLAFAPYEPVDAGGDEPPWGSVIEHYVLLDRVSDLQVSYRLPGNPAWVTSTMAVLKDQGEPVPVVPALVSISLVADDHQWPPIVVAIDGVAAQ